MKLPRQPTLSDLRAFFDAGGTPEQAVRDAYARIAAVADPGIFLSLVPIDDAVAMARRLPSRNGPLWGVPFAVKDNIDVAGVPTTAACPDFAYTPKDHAFCVARLVAAGAIPIGKTNLDQFATGLVGTRTPHAVPRNAIDATLVPGGSSSGSAVAVATGIVTFSLGTDTAGSGRVPAALNGIVGLKPTRGAVSNRGVVPACRSLDCVSVFAQNVTDAWDVFDALQAFDAGDAYSRPYRHEAPAAASGVRFGVLSERQSEFFGDRAAAAAYRSHVERLRMFGTVVEFDAEPFLAAGRLLYGGAWIAERHAGLREFLDSHANSLHPVTREVLARGFAFSAADAFASMHRLAELRRVTEPTWARVDVLALPTASTAPTLAAVAAEPIAANMRLGVYATFVNLLDLAALAVPGTRRGDGLPAGLTFVAPAGRDAFLAGVGGAYLGEAPPKATAPDRIQLVVVGAHMRGLPLNGQLTELGAAFVRADRTLPNYRLYEIAGSVRRPGLLRVAEHDGAAIAVEVWSLTSDAFGRFVAAVAVPLSIGNVHLQASGTVKGFLVEAEATRGARDITASGGWREFLAAGPAAGS